MKIYITGIAGFLGSHLAKRLQKLGREISGNDTLILGDLVKLFLSKLSAGPLIIIKFYNVKF